MTEQKYVDLSYNNDDLTSFSFDLTAPDTSYNNNCQTIAEANKLDLSFSYFMQPRKF